MTVTVEQITEERKLTATEHLLGTGMAITGSSELLVLGADRKIVAIYAPERWRRAYLGSIQWPEGEGPDEPPPTVRQLPGKGESGGPYDGN